jgi:hypothetical protein
MSQEASPEEAKLDGKRKIDEKYKNRRVKEKEDLHRPEKGLRYFPQ